MEKIQTEVHSKIISIFPGFDRVDIINGSYIEEHPEQCLEINCCPITYDMETCDRIIEHHNVNYLNDFLKQVQDNIGKYEYIFVPHYEEVRKTLEDACIFYFSVFPTMQRKKEFINYYEEEYLFSFIVDYESNWEKYINSMRIENINHHNIELTVLTSIEFILKRIDNLSKLIITKTIC